MLRPLAASSFAIRRVMPATPLFEAVYAGTRMPPWKERTEATLIIFPLPCSTITRPAAWESRKTAFKFTCITSSQSRSLNSRTGVRRMMPALLTRISRPPNSATTRATNSFRSLACASSKLTLSERKRRPRARTRVAVFSSEPLPNPAISAPASAKATAIACPKPRPAPVTRATLSSSLN